jgi:hypothetical protein
MAEDILAKSLGIMPYDVDFENSVTPYTPDDQKQSNFEEATDDFDTVRNNLFGVMETSQQILTDMIDIAKQSQHPKAYEVLNSMIKTITDVNMSLLELQTKKQKLIESSPAESSRPQNVTNNLFVGTNADLNKLLDDVRNSMDKE